MAEFFCIMELASDKDDTRDGVIKSSHSPNSAIFSLGILILTLIVNVSSLKCPY